MIQKGHHLRRTWHRGLQQLPRSTGTADHYVCRQCRAIQISAAPNTQSPTLTGAGAGKDAFGAPVGGLRDAADAHFEIIGGSSPLLSVSLSASQKLYTRRGTLVGLSGKPETTQSTLSILNPLTRAAFGVPFIYQRISATTPITALVSTKAVSTTFSVLHLDGRTDWMVAQRNALLAWTGHTLSLSSRIQRGLSLAHWGSTLLTGRGLAALSSPGQIYQLTLAPGEEMAIHPGSVVAYSVTRNPPQPFRFKSSSMRFQVPSLTTSWIPESEFLRNMRKTSAYRYLCDAFYKLRTMTRRTIWGDRLFLQFKGPATILMSSRGVRVADVLSNRQINEIADAPAGELARVVELATTESEVEVDSASVSGSGSTSDQVPSAIHVAEVGKNGKVTFEDRKDLKEFV